MNICVIGSGFTGLLVAISIKKKCPQAHVTIIDSTEPKNSGFGESTPGEFLRWFVRTLDIPVCDRSRWINRFMVETNSTLKYSVKFADFTAPNDAGFYNSMRLVPDHRVIFNHDFDGGETPMEWVAPDNKSYRLFDIWYELYKQGRRDIEDFQADLDPYYWFNEDNRVNWREDSFASTYTTAHINSFETGRWLSDNYGQLIDRWVQGTVREINTTETGSIRSLTLDSGEEIKSHFYIDCTGFKRLVAKRMELKWQPASAGIRHNAALVTANRYTDLADMHEKMDTYTTNAAMDYGWMFRIPLLDRKSHGYVFNTNQRSPEQVLAELDRVSDPATRTVDPFLLRWEPGSYENSWQNNYCLVGLAAGFVDAFEGSAIILQMQQIDTLIKFINNPVADRGNPESFSRKLIDTMGTIGERLDLTFGLAPRNNTDYWLTNHEIAREKRMREQLFDIIGDYRHSPSAMFNGGFVAWQDHFYYCTGIYYGIDMSPRLRSTDSNTLALAEQYFKNQSSTNRIRANISPTESAWFASQGLDLNKILGV
jgi:tryptophan 7-halogenase